MIATSKPSAPFISTTALETLARELFNGAMPKLSGDGWKRRCQLAKEFADAHLSIPGVAKPDPKKHAALAPAFRAIAASRQARVDSFLAALQQPRSVATIRTQLVAALGERALQAKLGNARHQIALALVLVDALEGKSTALDLNLADAGAKLVARLDAAFGQSGRERIIPRGPYYIASTLQLLSGLAEAVAENKAGVGFAATAAKPATTPASASRAPAATVPKHATVESIAGAIRAEPDAGTRARLYLEFIALSDKP